MKTVGKKVLDDSEYDMIRNLVTVGLDRMTATAIVGLHALGPSIGCDLETATGLRQPMVSMAMKKLRQRGWATSVPVDGSARRPCLRHELVVPLVDIVKELETSIRTKTDKALAGLRAI